MGPRLRGVAGDLSFSRASASRLGDLRRADGDRACEGDLGAVGDDDLGGARADIDIEGDERSVFGTAGDGVEESEEREVLGVDADDFELGGLEGAHVIDNDVARHGEADDFGAASRRGG